jgi:hypothetical protein
MPASRSIIPRCNSAAQRTASTTLENSANIPSPVVLTMRPECSLIFGSTSSRRCALSRSCVPETCYIPVNIRQMPRSGANWKRLGYPSG